MSPLRLAHDNFNEADIFACTSGDRKAATRLALISGSELSVLLNACIGWLGSKSACLRASLPSFEWIGLPLRLALIAALNAGSAHLARIFACTSGRLDGLLSPVNLAFTSGSFMRAVIFARVSGLYEGLFSFMRLLSAAFSASDIYFLPSPPLRKLVNVPVFSWILPYFSIKLRSNSCASSKVSFV